MARLTARSSPGSAASAYQGAQVTDSVEVPQLVGIDDGVDRLDLTVGYVERHDSDQPVLRVDRHGAGLANSASSAGRSPCSAAAKKR